MKRSTSRRSHSWWWDSHNIPKHSKWLAENLEVMDQAVKRMLKLIEEDADSFSKKAEMYYEKRPELVSNVEEFYRMYRSLAERYNTVTGELHKSIPASLQAQESDGGFVWEAESESPSLSASIITDSERSEQALGVQRSLIKGNEKSSSSSEFDSEYESNEVISNNCLSNLVEKNHDCELHQSVIKSENRILVSKVAENGVHNQAKSSVLENELTAANDRILDLEEEVARLNDELKLREYSDKSGQIEEELRCWKMAEKDLQEQVMMLEKEIFRRENVIEEIKSDISNIREYFTAEKSHLMSDFTSLQELHEATEKYFSDLHQQFLKLQGDLSERESTIEELKAEISETSGRFVKEKLQLEGRVSGLIESHALLETQLSSLYCEIDHLNLEKSERALELNRLEEEYFNKTREVEDMNSSYDLLKVKYDTLAAENQELSARLGSLVADVSSRDDQIRHKSQHLHCLHNEHLELIRECECVKRVVEELKGRMRELEEEVERQRLMIVDHAEGKREAIRQLCFSLEHYRDGYKRLRQALHGHNKQPAVAT